MIFAALTYVLFLMSTSDGCLTKVLEIKEVSNHSMRNSHQNFADKAWQKRRVEFVSVTITRNA